MVTRDLIKEEIDRMQEEYLEILYRIIKALESPLDSDESSPGTTVPASNWEEFIEATYGCLTDNPIERGEQGQFEIRETIL